MRNALILAVWLLPSSPFKNRLLTLLGHAVHSSVQASPNLVWKVRAFTMAPGSRISLGNVVKNMDSVELAESAAIGRFNLISAHPAYARNYTVAGSLKLENRSKITSSHKLDCSGGVFLGEFSSIGGKQALILTHSIDFTRDTQAAYPVRLGAYSFVAARCLVLGGATLPDRSVLAAGSVLPRSSDTDGPQGLYAGTPAKFKTKLEGAWFERTERMTTSLYVPETDSVVDDVL